MSHNILVIFQETTNLKYPSVPCWIPPTSRNGRSRMHTRYGCVWHFSVPEWDFYFDDVFSWRLLPLPWRCYFDIPYITWVNICLCTVQITLFFFPSGYSGIPDINEHSGEREETECWMCSEWSDYQSSRHVGHHQSVGGRLPSNRAATALWQ